MLTRNPNVAGDTYLIDNDDSPAFSTNTFGLRVTGSADPGISVIALYGGYARQSDAVHNLASFDTDYFGLQGGWSNDALCAGTGLESTGSGNAQSFRTPLAPLHVFD